MLIAARNGFMVGKRLPYDAEVEYLEMPQTDSGRPVIYLPSREYGTNVKIIIDVLCPTTNLNWKGLWGTIINNQTQFRIYQVWNSARYFAFCCNSDGTSVPKFPYGNRTTIEIPAQNPRLNVYVNGTLQTHATTTSRPVVPASIVMPLMGTSNYRDGVFGLESTAVPGTKLYQYTEVIDNEKRLDLTPVRFTNELGQSEGAMYDRLGVGGMNPDGSPRTDGLYRNRGTGDFVIGPDK